MIDLVVNKVKSFWRRETQRQKILVLIQTKSGEQYLIDSKYFVTRKGWTIAEKRHLEGLSKAARRVMRYVSKSVSETDYVVILSTNLGSNRNNIVVWFPSPDQFDPEIEKWKGKLLSLRDAPVFLDRADCRAIKTAFKKAVMHYQESVAQVA